MSEPVVMDLDQITEGLSNLAMKLKETSTQLDIFASGILDVMEELLKVWIINETTLRGVEDEMSKLQKELKEQNDRQLVLKHLHFLPNSNIGDRLTKTVQLVDATTKLIEDIEREQTYLVAMQMGLVSVFNHLGNLVTGIKTPEDRTVRQKLTKLIKSTLVIGGKSAVNALFGFNISGLVNTVVR